MRKVASKTAALLAGGVLACANAYGSDPAEIGKALSLQPIQGKDVLCDTPAEATWPKCTLDVVKKSNPTIWVLRDMRGVAVRKLVSVDGRHLDQRSFYLNGQEVYRDVDTDRNGKFDAHRWFNAGGTRWGVSSNEDGRIDQWKALSAEEAVAEAVAALAARDWPRMQAVLLNANEVKELGLDEKSSVRVSAEMAKAQSDFQKLVASIPADLKWNRFDGNAPWAVPASDAGSSKDLVLYHNGTVVADASGKQVWLRAPEVVKLGDVWKLTSVPVLLDEKKQVESAGVLVPAIDFRTLAGDTTGDTPVEASEEVQALVAELQKHDDAMPKDGDAKALATYHVARHALCAKIGGKSKKLGNREHWYRQAADSLDAAVQTRAYPEGVQYLETYAKGFADLKWGVNLAAYFKYRAINAAFSIAMEKEDHAKAQEKYLADLAEFVKNAPATDDVADALWQLGNGMEFQNKEHVALTHYKRLVADHPKSQFGAKAAGAVRRLEGVGSPLRLEGVGLDGRQIDTAQLRGRVILVHYWATYCEPCKAEMPKLAALREKFAKQGLEVVGVCVDKDGRAAAAHIERTSVNWPQLYEKDALDGPLAVQYGIISLPTMMLVDEEGKILSRNLQANSMEIEVEKAVAKRIASKNN